MTRIGDLSQLKDLGEFDEGKDHVTSDGTDNRD